MWWCKASLLRENKTSLHWQDWAWWVTAGLVVFWRRQRRLAWSTARRPSSLPSIRFLLRKPSTATAATWAELPATRSTSSPWVPLRRFRPPHLQRQWSGSIRPAAPSVPHRWDSTPKIADPLHLRSSRVRNFSISPNPTTKSVLHNKEWTGDEHPYSPPPKKTSKILLFSLFSSNCVYRFT